MPFDGRLPPPSFLNRKTIGKADMADQEKVQLEGGTYEVLRNRLSAQARELSSRLGKLDAARKDTFGTIETRLLESRRITTSNNCIPRDIFAIGDRFLFGYNVQFGLKTSIKPEDVFAVYRMEEQELNEEGLDLLNSGKFLDDFQDLYKYYKNTIFVKFARIGPHLHMVFRIGKEVSDVKTFKWLIRDGALEYIDNRSDHEYRFPNQHEFEWVRTHRNMHRDGVHPHVSVEDRVFIETVGGDLTIKVEDNTESGEGIYAEAVDQADQTLDDAEMFYALVGNLILLKIRPYLEKNFRYFVFNEKLKSVRRIDTIEHSCVLLPDSHGLIFANGYYLQSGEYKLFDHVSQGMLFEQRISAPNGEDHLYCFYNRRSGQYILLSYNIIAQQVETPVLCHGFTLLEDGRMILFRSEEEPSKHHVAQVWQTPFTRGNWQPETHGESPLSKIGNRDIVRAMAECQEIIKLIGRDDPYEALYSDLVKTCTGLRDSYFWINKEETFKLGEVLGEIQNAAAAAIEEFEKVNRQQKHSREKVAEVSARTRSIMAATASTALKSVEEYVNRLAELRAIRGEIIALRELRYVDIPAVDELEEQVGKRTEVVSLACVEFLLGENALDPYRKKLEEHGERIEKIERGSEARALGEEVDKSAGQLDLLIEIVSNLKIDDPVKTSTIIDGISAVYTRLNQVRARLRNHTRELMSGEAVVEFGSQVKLLGQSVVNFLDVSDSPEKCDEYLNRLLVQIEGLEGRFADFDEFIIELAEKREEIQDAFESRELALQEARNKRATALQTAANRILKGIEHRAGTLKSVEEISAYFATDLMVDKIRDTVRQLTELGDNVKADEIGTRLKMAREEAVRQLKDRQELYIDGANIIRLGRHSFSVSTQKLDLTTIYRDNQMWFHLSGTAFFELVTDPEFLATRDSWDQDLPSEDRDVYRSEYLAWLFHREGLAGELAGKSTEEMAAAIQRFMAPRYQEGYVKGVHDHDAALILGVILELEGEIGLLRYRSRERAMAAAFWEHHIGSEAKERYTRRARGLGTVLKTYPGAIERKAVVADLTAKLQSFADETGFFPGEDPKEAADFLFDHLCSFQPMFPISGAAASLRKAFWSHLEQGLQRGAWEESLKGLEKDFHARWEVATSWLRGFLASHESREGWVDLANEVATLLLSGLTMEGDVLDVIVRRELEGLQGEHPRIDSGVYHFDYPEFMHRLNHFVRDTLPGFVRYQDIKRRMIDKYRDELRLDEFQPRVLSSFVRNRLIDDVYLPVIGDNFAKQMGTVGETTRTDRMGLLLLVSPPGYGKTTIMEYLASRLGLVFVKINGPAIGHRVTSLDPAEAPNASCREEMQKLNLSLEMGDNVMIYLDDIQHLNPEFLQKFISLCDGSRRIEGTFKGRARTYDLRGRRVCVVMAGNPYTESGEKFQIPDMLANRADTYNLGDLIGEQSREVFELSYIENALTSNPALNRLATQSRRDIINLIRLADTGDREGIEFEGNYSAEEINEYVAVLQKMRRVQQVILKVNQEYIRSAAQSDDYRTEPSFKLQGSYRNMNKLAEKIVAVMNEEELNELLMSHYEGESQTLTSGAEANLLKFKELVEWLSPQEAQRWADIKETFRKNNRLRGLKEGDHMGQLLMEVGEFTGNLATLREAIATGFDRLAKGQEPLPAADHPMVANLSPETLETLEKIFANVRVNVMNWADPRKNG